MGENLEQVVRARRGERLAEEPEWVWLALCRRTRQVVASAHIPTLLTTEARRSAACSGSASRALHHALAFTDFLRRPASELEGLPEDGAGGAAQHFLGGKGSGQTNHITPIKPHPNQASPQPSFERFNNTLRQHLARFVRKTLSFSKSEVMNENCLRLFFHHYNTVMALGAAHRQQPA